PKLATGGQLPDQLKVAGDQGCVSLDDEHVGRAGEHFFEYGLGQAQAAFLRDIGIGAAAHVDFQRLGPGKAGPLDLGEIPTISIADVAFGAVKGPGSAVGYPEVALGVAIGAAQGAGEGAALVGVERVRVTGAEETAGRGQDGFVVDPGGFAGGCEGDGGCL